MEQHSISRRWLGWLLIVLIIIAGFLQYYKISRPPKLGPGILVPEDPELLKVNYNKTWKFGKYLITPLASCTIRGRIIKTEHYHWDRGADLSPVDVLVGWGGMSSQEVLETLSFSQGNRAFRWKIIKPLSVTEGYIKSHTANLHLIPANDALKKVIKSLHVDQIVIINGYLVQVTADDGYKWTSNLDNTDNTTNKVVWVDSLTIVKG